MITRRSALAGTGTGLAALTLAAPAIRAQTPTRIRVSTAAPPSDFLARALEQMKTEVEQAQVGLTVEPYPAGTLFKQGTEVPALQRGTLEMSTMTTFEVAQQMPQYGFFDRGYLFRDYDHMRRVFDGPIGQSYIAAVADKMGIQILATAYLGTRQVDLRQKKTVMTPADLGGIKLRMTQGTEWLLLGRAIGAAPVPMGMAEVYLAMKTGTIDGQENPLSILNAAKLYEVSEQVVLTAHMLQPVFFNIASPVWSKLTPPQQEALRRAAQNAARGNDQGRLGDEKTIATALVGRGLTVGTPDLDAFRAYAAKVYAESDMTKAWDAGIEKQIAATG